MIKNYKQLVPRYLIANKKTSLSMVISILFSVAMLVSVSMFIGKYNAARIEMAQAGHGKYHAGFSYVREDTLGKLKRFKGTAQVGTTITVGELPMGSDRMEIKGADITAFDLLNVKALKGRVPEKDDEVAIEQWMYSRLEKKPEIGERFKLKYSRLDSSGHTLETKESEFVFCGILEDFEESKNFQTGKAYVTLDTANKLIGKIFKAYEQWVELKDTMPVELTLEDLQAYALGKTTNEEHIVQGYRGNFYYLTALEQARIAKSITFVFNIIVAVAVALVIYNVFNISVLQRKKHYGLLRAIGITQKQIKLMLFLEAFLFEAIVVPIGIAIGILSTALLTRVIGGTILKGSIFKQITPFNILLPVFVSLISIAAAVYSPAKLASKVSAIESMSMEGKKSTKKLYRASKFKIFDYTGKMALNNLKRYKKRFAATVTAIAVGIALFIFSSYVINVLTPASILEVAGVRADYVLCFSSSIAVKCGYSDEIINKIERIPGVKTVNKFKLLHIDYMLDSKFMTETGIKESKKGVPGIGCIDERYDVVSQVYGCSDEFLLGLRKNVSDSDNKGEVFIVQNLDYKNYTKIKNGDEVEMLSQYLNGGKFVSVDKTTKVDYVLKKPPFKINELQGFIATFVPYKFLEDNFKVSGFQKVEINVDKNANLIKIEQELKSIADGERYGKLISYESETQKYHSFQQQLGGLLMSIVVVIIFVGLINIMNTLNMNIIIRKREFGMLRALGFTKKDMKKTLLKEAAIYGVVSSIIGVLMGYLLIWIVYRLARSIFNLKFYVDIKLIVLTFVVTVLLGVCSSILPLKKATTEDIVESIQAVE